MKEMNRCSGCQCRISIKISDKINIIEISRRASTAENIVKMKMRLKVSKIDI